MAQVIKGNPSHKQAPNTQSRAAPSHGSGMIVGAVINKPVEVHPTVVATAAAVPAPAVTVANPNAIMQAQLPPGMIAISHQAIAMSTPLQPTILSSHNGTLSLSPTDGALLDHLALANTKEKTPMCLINELARFNKQIQHQYTLTDEQGPAHKKTFFVKLKLGEEEYSASGPSIKKAQHAAADIALEQTQYKHPPPKPPRSMTDGSRWDSDSITPTVELNALAMKRGEPAVYHPIEMQPRPPQFYPPPNMDFRGMYNQRYHYPRAPTVFYVSLKVGQREFIGEGRTRQAARHNAADKALKVLRSLPLPIGMVTAVVAVEKKEDGSMVAMCTSPAMVVESDTAQEMMMDDITDGMNGLMKSEISLVHEIALKRNLPVNFEVTRESGPPHMRTFVTRCSCGELVYEADGNSKKLSKKRAAEGMLDKLRELPGIPAPSISKPKKSPGNKKKNRNLIKVEKATPDYGVGINPISRLIQIQQAKKEKEPVYTLFAERGLPRRREFVMQVSVGEQTCTGVGPNKKLAKRNAAEAMLQLLGYSRPAPQPSKPAMKTTEPTGGVNTDKKVTFMDNQANPTYEITQAHYPLSPARQLVPGVILMSDVQRAQAASTVYSTGPSVTATASIIRSQDIGVKFSPQTTAAIAKELLDTGASPTAESITKSCAQVAAAQSVVRPKQQLLYLADVLGFQVQFTDFPKGNNRTEYLSLVSLSTNPPQVSHGAGPTIEASHDTAAITALTALSELGLDAVVPSAPAAAQKSITDNGAAGDGPHVKDEKKLANSVTDVSNKTAETK